MSAWARLRGSLALTVTAWIFGFVSVIILVVIGYLLFHEYRLLDRELRERGLLIAGHLAQQSVDPILREDDYALAFPEAWCGRSAASVTARRLSGLGT